MPPTAGIGAPQQHAGWLSLLFSEIEGLLQSEFQCTGTVGGKAVGNMPDVFFHKCDRFRVLEVRNEEFALHLRNPILANGTGLSLSSRNKRDPYSAVTGEKTSSTTLFRDSLFLISANALLRRGFIPSLNSPVNIMWGVRLGISPSSLERRCFSASREGAPLVPYAHEYILDER